MTAGGHHSSDNAQHAARESQHKTERKKTYSLGAHAASQGDLPRRAAERPNHAGEQRVKGRRADPLAQRLVTAYATETLLLADPSDLPYDAALLDDDSLVDEAKMRAAVDDLIPAKSHLASHTPRNDVGRTPATTSSTSASRTCCATELSQFVATMWS